MRLLRTLGLLLLGAVLVWTLVGGRPAGGNRPAVASRGQAWAQTTTAATQPVSLSSQAAALWAQGVEKALVGRFADSLEDLRQAARLEPNHASIAASVELVEKHLAAMERWDRQRAAEFERAADRVRRSLLAESYRPSLDNDKLFQPLRQKVLEIDHQFARLATAQNLEESGEEQIERFRRQGAEVVQKTTEALAEAEKLLKDTDNAYAVMFRLTAGALRQRLVECGQAWAAVQGQTPRQRHQAARAIRQVQENLEDALADLAGLVTEEPWRAGLVQARVAKHLASDPNRMMEHAWYRQLVQNVVTRGQTAMKDGRWFDALNAYNGLTDLSPEIPEYRQQRNVAARHVRVLGLYGRKGDANAPPPAAGGGEDDDEETETRWQELIQGVDCAMVHSVITQLDSQYVTPVDYRQLVRGALTAVRVLAETPQAANSFPALADKDLRRKFLEALDREQANVDRSDHVDHTTLQMVLNTVLRESERTVNLPLGVLAVEFTDGFLREMDRFSSMVWPSGVEDFNKQTMGQFYGVGIQISKEPNAPLKVVSPLPNSPALREGIKTGDLILTVDGKRTEPLSIDRLVKMITGRRGTKVVLDVLSRGADQSRQVTLVRDEIQVHTVKGWRLQSGGNGDNWEYLVDPERKVGYIRISQFTGQTHGALTKALRELAGQDVRSLVLDLRYNPGGLLESSKEVVDEFLRSGRIVSTRGRQKAQRDYQAAGEGLYLSGDLVVLVNEMSASAAEIVSGALRDWKRGVVIGERTFGKGSVQNVLQIPNHTAYLKLTTAYYYLPSGRLLHRKEGEPTWGVDPDVAVRMTPRQTQRWLDLRSKTDLLQEVDTELLKEDLAEEYRADPQLNTAVLILRLMQLQDTPSA